SVFTGQKYVYLDTYQLPIERRVELISDLVKYQDNYTKIYRFQSQQRKPWTKKKKRDYYMTAERIKRKGINLEQESAKKQKKLEEVTEEAKPPEEVTKEKVKEMMQLVPIEEVYVEDLQVKHPIIDWKHLDREDLNQLWRLVKETLSNRPPTSDKEMELWVELNRMYEPDKEDQLKGQALVMICYKLQVKNFSQMANDLVLKIYKIANSPRQQVKKDATARRKVKPLPGRLHCYQ
nr:hypothetical protein [Tanacetum cinerariifolium]